MGTWRDAIRVWAALPVAALAAGGLALAPAAARAAIVASGESSLEAPDLLPATASGGILARGEIAPGGADVFALDLAEGDWLAAAVVVEGGAGLADPVLAVFAPGDTSPTAVDDDGGAGLWPSLRLRVPAAGAGSWRIAVAGFGADPLAGAHGESFRYRLVVARPPPTALESDEAGNATSPEPIGPPPFDALAPGGVAIVEGLLRADLGPGGDIDRYAIPVDPGRLLSVAIFDRDGDGFEDPALRLLRGDASEVTRDDDGGPGLLAGLATRIDALAAETWEVEVRRFTDEPGVDEPLPYALVVSSSGRLCDVDGDEFVDESDIDAIFAARGSLATGPADARDLDGDGRISVGDGRACALRCDLANCAPAPAGLACGLLGPELLIVLAPFVARARRRGARGPARLSEDAR